MDPLSTVIRQSSARSITVGATDVGGDLAIRFSAHRGAYLYSVAAGECLLRVEGEAQVFDLRAGDCVLLPSGRPFLLASNLDLPPIDAEVVFSGRSNGSIGVYNAGGRCKMFAAHFEFDTGFSRLLLGVLDCVVQVQDPEARMLMRSAIEQMIDELQHARVGSEVVVEHLAHIALIKLLRLHLLEAAKQRPGWLFALADRKMSQAITAMHESPSEPWTVESLARSCAMSRTAFATRFKRMVGTAPLDYLTQLRMVMASQRLLQPGSRVAAVAHELGYGSESSFSSAFKRVMGLSPRQYADHAGANYRAKQHSVAIGKPLPGA